MGRGVHDQAAAEEPVAAVDRYVRLVPKVGMAMSICGLPSAAGRPLANFTEVVSEIRAPL